jgi:hypothetical protein
MHTGGGGGRGGGGTSCTPSNDFGKFGHQNSIKHEKEDPSRFSHNPKYASKEFENECASMIDKNQYFADKSTALTCIYQFFFKVRFFD